MNPIDYFQSLKQEFDSLVCLCSVGTPYNLLGQEISEMVCSYLDDSVYFSKKSDFVNQYASLVYAQGWLNAGLYLGLITFQNVQPDFSLVSLPDQYDENHLLEKEARYNEMLTAALESISIILPKGSPLFPAGSYCVTSAKNALITACQLQERRMMVPALGHLCFGYGWLDTAVRSGLVRIERQPELFTTDT